jgi:alpha-ketoglutarate-dependent taurine dioxygenase
MNGEVMKVPIIDKRLLSEAEYSKESTNRKIPTVFSPGTMQPFEAVLQEIRERKDELLNQMCQDGAILLRGFDIKSLEDCHCVLEAIGIPLNSDDLCVGEVIRKKVDDYASEVTMQDSNEVVPPHTEGYFWYRQPKSISFYCEKANCRYGETPLFDCVNILKALPPKLLRKLQGKKVLMQFEYSASETDRSAISKTQIKNTWQQVFNTQDKSVVEKALDRDDVEYDWKRTGALLVKVYVDLIAKHPMTGEKCFRGVRYLFLDSLIYMSKHFIRPRLGVLSSAKLIVKALLAKTIDTRKVYWTDSLVGINLCRKEKRLLVEAYFNNCAIFKWQTGDLLLVDNIKVGHARLNIKGERNIYAFAGEYIDQKKLEA